MSKWEIMQMSLSTRGDWRRAELNTAGAEGWELVCVDGDASYWKRPLPTTDAQPEAGPVKP